jgi:hypothetical protein
VFYAGHQVLFVKYRRVRLDAHVEMASVLEMECSKLFRNVDNFTYTVLNSEDSLNPWCIVVENLIVTQLVKKFPAFYGPPRFITMFTKDRHLSLS